MYYFLRNYYRMQIFCYRPPIGSMLIISKCFVTELKQDIRLNLYSLNIYSLCIFHYFYRFLLCFCRILGSIYWINLILPRWIRFLLIFFKFNINFFFIIIFQRSLFYINLLSIFLADFNMYFHSILISVLCLKTIVCFLLVT